MEFLLLEWIKPTLLAEAGKLLVPKVFTANVNKQESRTGINADALLVHLNDTRVVQIIDVYLSAQ